MRADKRSDNPERSRSSIERPDPPRALLASIEAAGLPFITERIREAKPRLPVTGARATRGIARGECESRQIRNDLAESTSPKFLSSPVGPSQQSAVRRNYKAVLRRHPGRCDRCRSLREDGNARDPIVASLVNSVARPAVSVAAAPLSPYLFRRCRERVAGREHYFLRRVRISQHGQLPREFLCDTRVRYRLRNALSDISKLNLGKASKSLHSMGARIDSDDISP